jgi:CRISPR-associated protein Cmr1
MTLRTIPNHLQPPTMPLKSQQQKWHTLDYTIVTPIYGGGVDAHKVDEKMPIRISAIRGQLRFWWRLLARQPSWKLGNADDIRRAEFALWGGMDDKDPVASKVLIKVSTVGQAKVQPWASFQPNHNNKLTLQSEKWADLPYALFPAQGKLEFGKVTEQPHELAQAGLQWKLAIHFTHGKPLKAGRPNFNPNITPDEEAQVWETIRWWSNFGGIGARTRRGLGAVHLNSVSTDVPPKILTPITVEEAQTAGCQLVLKGASTHCCPTIFLQEEPHLMLFLFEPYFLRHEDLV